MTKSHGNRRMWVKIRQGKSQGWAVTVYFHEDLTLELYNKWKWYFEYRAALLKVDQPRSFVELTWGSYEMENPDEIYYKRLRDRMIARKRKITEYKTKIRLARENWNQLFPIEEEEDWKKAVAKVERLEKELEAFEAEYNKRAHETT